MSLLVLARIRVGVRVALPSRRWICRLSFLLNILRLERPDANGPGLLRAGPSGEEQSTLHYTVPVSRAARSAISYPSPNSGHRASCSKYTRGQSRETGSLSRSPGGVRAPAKRVSLGPACAESGYLVFLKDDVGLRTVVSNRRLLRQSCCHGPGLMKAGPSGEEQSTPHYTVPVSPQCPQEISLLTLPVFQGAAVSSEHFSQSLPPGNVAELRGSPPLLGVSRAATTSGHRASSSKYIRGQS